MKVIRADKLGFCFGVERAIKLATQAMQDEDLVYSLGPIIHNKQVVDRLAEQGLTAIESLEEVTAGTVVIRSHGVRPETMDLLRRQERGVVDATCPLVRRAQKTVRLLHQEGYQVVMIGDVGHPEVQGIIGYAPDVIVVDDTEHLDGLPTDCRLGIVIQTTHSPAHFSKVLGEIASRPFKEIKIVNTVCQEVQRRQNAAIDLCTRVDVMFVLGGLQSANTQELARLCHQQSIPTYHIENWDSFDLACVDEHETAGVTAGASTPPWVIEEFIENLQSLVCPV